MALGSLARVPPLQPDQWLRPTSAGAANGFPLLAQLLEPALASMALVLHSLSLVGLRSQRTEPHGTEPHEARATVPRHCDRCDRCVTGGDSIGELQRNCAATPSGRTGTEPRLAYGNRAPLARRRGAGGMTRGTALAREAALPQHVARPVAFDDALARGGVGDTPTLWHMERGESRGGAPIGHAALPEAGTTDTSGSPLAERQPRPPACPGYAW
mmetsp:Transcript_49632/g.108002  ORF Transcript_49632/g.108002 Transcript_49632/m.108002 type:complete len:214 (-) Transcript_49632:136-777(-)